MNKTRCAIMFVDISGSTQLYEQLGDEVAKHAIDKCLAQLGDIVVAQNGIVVKSIGDELMCRFESPSDAVIAAIASQVEVGNLKLTGLSHIAIRAAIHFGDVIEDGNDLFGDAVNIAARMTGIARSGQIVTTESTVGDLPDELVPQTRQIDLTPVKGKAEKIAVYEVLWEKQDRITRISTDLLARMENLDSVLILRFGEQKLEIGKTDQPVVIGRSDKCDLVVNTGLASREHALIERRRGKFIITDQGTNGTYLTTNSGQDVFLRREEFILHGEGQFSLGKPIAHCAPGEVIHYEC